MFSATLAFAIAQSMPLDSHGNFYPVFPGMPPFAASDSAILSGAGAPDNSLGNNGDIYVNISNGDIYTKSGDVWTIKATGDGGGTESGNGSPEGVLSAPVGKLYTDVGDPYYLWSKVSGSGNTGWVQLI